ncbi:MAG: hypothetical protein KGS72_25055 [Cyanobacteria bacterium REEB67]|nr:hypothetical protein [Cyanobacteria bacterium REEB67]
MFIFGSLSLIPLAIILLGAYKVWMGTTHVLSKLLSHQPEEPHIKKWAGIIVFVSILFMVAPLLIPTGLYFKDAVGVLYAVYVGTAGYQIYTFFASRNKTSK